MKDISSRLMVDQLFSNTGTVTRKNYPESYAENLRLLTEVDQFFNNGVGNRDREIKWQLEVKHIGVGRSHGLAGKSSF